MKQFRSFRILSLAIALISLFSAAPFQAQSSVIVPITGFQFDRVDADENWVFSWNTIQNESAVQFQVTGGGLMDAWHTVRARKLTRSGGKTELAIARVNSLSGYALRFRLKLNEFYHSTRTDWMVYVMNFDPS